MRAAMQAANIFRSEPVQTREIRDAEIDCVLMQIQAHAMLGNFEEAFNAGVEHGRRFKDLQNRRGEGCVLMKLVDLHRRRLETDKAMKVLQFIPNLFSLAGDRVQEGRALEQIARILLEKGDVLQAQKVADACAMNFRKYGSRFYRGRAALLAADVQVNLLSIDKGSPVQLLEVAQEAVYLLRSCDDLQKSEFAMALQILANSQLLSGMSKEAVETSRESQDQGGEVSRKQQQASAEASALLLEAGAHVQQQDFGESQRWAGYIMAVAMERPPVHRLRHTGASILSGTDSVRSSRTGSRAGDVEPEDMGYARQENPGPAALERPPPMVPMPGGAFPVLDAPWIPQMPGDMPFGMESSRSGNSRPEAIDERPPSASRSGLLYTDPRPQKTSGFTAGCHPGKLRHEEWPLHAVPLFIFGGVDRPRPAYREEIKFTLRNDKYVSFALRLRCGTGDHYMGGTVGLMHSPDRQEALVGDKGQLATIIDLVVQPDNSVIVTALGDLDFVAARTWMPRGLRGLQLAFVDVHKTKTSPLQPILQTCNEEPGFGLFGQLLARAKGFEDVASALSGADGPFTVFVPRDMELMDLLGGGSLQDMLQTPHLPALLACHIVRGKVPFEAPWPKYVQMRAELAGFALFS
eukprot:s2130_g5.t1